MSRRRSRPARPKSNTLDLALPGGALVVDLGAGFGMHAIPLARAGARVIAVDSSAQLLGELTRLAADAPVSVVHDDLLSFRSHLGEKAAAIFCMGDTLTHLPEHTNVDFLVQEVAEALAPGGQFVLSFRDYSEALLDASRFIPVRSDERRILMCFLEYEEDSVVVNDVLHERGGDALGHQCQQLSQAASVAGARARQPRVIRLRRAPATRTARHGRESSRALR